MLQKIALWLSVLTPTLTGLYFLWSWADTNLVTKQDLSYAITEIRLHQVAESIKKFHEKGLETLDDGQKHEYNRLVKIQEKLSDKRNKDMGIQ